MIINGSDLYARQPIKNMLRTKETICGTSYGLSEVGYDVRIQQTLIFHPPKFNPQNEAEAFGWVDYYDPVHDTSKIIIGRCVLASTLEEFNIPNNMWCEFRNKSTWARNFVDASLCTDGEPNWKGFLTLELVFQGMNPVTILAGSGIVKAVFHEITRPTEYRGKYQNQSNKPIGARS